MGNKNYNGPRLFADVQSDIFEKSYKEQLTEKSRLTVTCLGLTFASDEERCKHFTEKAARKTPGLGVPQDRRIPHRQ